MYYKIQWDSYKTLSLSIHLTWYGYNGSVTMQYQWSQELSNTCTFFKLKVWAQLQKYARPRWYTVIYSSDQCEFYLWVEGHQHMWYLWYVESDANNHYNLPQSYNSIYDIPNFMSGDGILISRGGTWTMARIRYSEFFISGKLLIDMNRLFPALYLCE